MKLCTRPLRLISGLAPRTSLVPARTHSTRASLRASTGLASAGDVTDPDQEIAQAVERFQETGEAPVLTRSETVVFPFGRSQPEVRCTPLRACDIELQAGEIVLGVALGDAERWVTSPLASGDLETPHAPRHRQAARLRSRDQPRHRHRSPYLPPVAAQSLESGDGEGRFGLPASCRLLLPAGDGRAVGGRPMRSGNRFSTKAQSRHGGTRLRALRRPAQLQLLRQRATASSPGSPRPSSMTASMSTSSCPPPRGRPICRRCWSRSKAVAWGSATTASATPGTSSTASSSAPSWSSASAASARRSRSSIAASAWGILSHGTGNPLHTARAGSRAAAASQGQASQSPGGPAGGARRDPRPLGRLLRAEQPAPDRPARARTAPDASRTEGSGHRSSAGKCPLEGRRHRTVSLPPRRIVPPSPPPRVEPTRRAPRPVADATDERLDRAYRAQVLVPAFERFGAEARARSAQALRRASCESAEDSHSQQALRPSPEAPSTGTMQVTGSRPGSDTHDHPSSSSRARSSRRS